VAAALLCAIFCAELLCVVPSTRLCVTNARKTVQAPRERRVPGPLRCTRRMSAPAVARFRPVPAKSAPAIPSATPWRRRSLLTRPTHVCVCDVYIWHLRQDYPPSTRPCQSAALDCRVRLVPRRTLACSHPSVRASSYTSSDGRTRPGPNCQHESSPSFSIRRLPSSPPCRTCSQTGHSLPLPSIVSGQTLGPKRTHRWPKMARACTVHCGLHRSQLFAIEGSLFCGRWFHTASADGVLLV